MCSIHLRNPLFNLLRGLSRTSCTVSSNIKWPVEGKRFVERENTFAYNVLKKTPFLRASLAAPMSIPVSVQTNDTAINWRQMTPKELVNNFVSLSFNAKDSGMDISSDVYKEMVDTIVASIAQFDDEDIERVLMSLSLWPMVSSIKAPNFYNLWKGLDSACLARWRKWPVEKVLRLIDHWYSLHLCRPSDFVFNVVTKYGNKPHKLNPHQLIQFLFYLNVIRSINSSIKAYHLEHRVDECIEEFTIEEIGIAAMGFFKTKHQWHNEHLVTYVMEKTEASIETIPEITLNSILKILRLSMGVKMWSRVPDFIETVASQLPRLSLCCAVHIPLLTTQSQIFLPTLLDKVSAKLISDLPSARLKDIEKVLYSLALVHYTPQVDCDLIELISNELRSERRADELRDYPKCFVAILHYLSIIQRCTFDLLPNVLNMDFIESTYGKSKYIIGREILSLDTCAELDGKDYNGPRLPTKLRDYLAKRYSVFLPDENRKMSKHSMFMLRVMKTVEGLFGKGFYSCSYILPNQPRADIIVRIDPGSLSPLPLPEEIMSREPFIGAPLWVPSEGVWLAIVAGSKNLFSFNHRHRLNGENSMKLRHLQLLGYTPVLVSEIDWPEGNDLSKDIQYLKSQVISSLQTSSS